MIEGQEKVGQVGFDLLDNIEREYGDREARVHQVIIGIEVEYTDDDGDRSTHVAYDYSAPRPVERQGLILNVAKAFGVWPV